MRFMLFPNRPRRRHPRLHKISAEKVKPVADAHPDWSDEQVAREVNTAVHHVRYYRNPPLRRDVPRTPFMVQREGQPTPWIRRKPFRHVYMAHRRVRRWIAKLTGKTYRPPWYSGLRPPRGVDVEERERRQTWAITEMFCLHHDEVEISKLFREHIRQRDLADPDCSEERKQQLADEDPGITPEEEWKALKFMSAWNDEAPHQPPWVVEKVHAFREAEPEAWLDEVLRIRANLAATAKRKHELNEKDLEAHEYTVANIERLVPLAQQAVDVSKR